MFSSLKGNSSLNWPGTDRTGFQVEGSLVDPSTKAKIQFLWQKYRARIVAYLPWLILCAGVGLRLFQYSFDRSLWLDEAFIATNLVHKSYGELLQELEFDQRAPGGFLLVEKMTMGVLGDSDLALRLFPLLCGLLSLFLFHALSKRLLPAGGVIIALTFFAFCPPLIYYTSELKQYGIEVTVTLMLLLAGDHALAGDRKSLLVLGFVGAIGIWFSFPAPFILAGVGLCLIVQIGREKNWRRLGFFALAGSMWLVSLTAFYLVQLRHFPENPGLKAMWEKGFMPLPPRSLDDLKWFPIRYFASIRDVTGNLFFGLTGLAFLIGVYTFFQKQRLRLCLLLGPVLFALVVSGLRIFPFQGRLILYLAPIVILIIGLGAWRMVQASAATLPLAGVALVALLLLPGLGAAAARTWKWQPYIIFLSTDDHMEEIKPVMAYIKERWRPGDVVYLYSQSTVAFQHYAPKYGFEPEDFIPGMIAELCLRDWSAVPSDLEKLRGRKRVWVLFSHVYLGGGVNEEKLYLYFLDAMGRRLEHYQPGPPRNDASVYLYDLSN